MSTQVQLTTTQTEELRRLKSYFPFRIVYGAINPTDNEYRTGAVTTMHQPNDLMRKGWAVFTLTGGTNGNSR